MNNNEQTQPGQSSTFLKLRRRIQRQMKKKNITYQDVLNWTKETTEEPSHLTKKAGTPQGDSRQSKN